MARDALNGKTIVVIGGTTGIGRSATEAFLGNGACVVAVGLEKAGLDDSEGLRVIEADGRNPSTAPDALALALDTFGSFHGLYHVAGGSGRAWGDGPLHAITEEAWNKTLDLNLSTVFYSNQAAVRAFQAAGTGGAILNLASVVALAPAPTHFGTVAYATAKSAVIGLTRAAAAAYAPENIRINALAPGLTDTPMARRAMANDAIGAYIKTKQPLDGGRAATPADLDEAAVFLLSDGARFVTGQVLTVDGGWSLSEGPHDR